MYLLEELVDVLHELFLFFDISLTKQLTTWANMSLYHLSLKSSMVDNLSYLPVLRH